MTRPSRRRHGGARLIKLVRSLIVLLALAAPVLAAAPAFAATPTASTASAALQSDLVALINQYRTANGLRALVFNASLTGAAQWMAADMAAGGYISHTSRDGRSPQQRMAAFGYPAYSMYVGEDLAAGQTSAATVIAGWKASSAHNAVLLSPNFDAIGIGYATNPATTYKVYWAADFGGPGASAPVAAPQPAPLAPTSVSTASTATVPTASTTLSAASTTTARAERIARGASADDRATDATAIDEAAVRAAARLDARLELWLSRVLMELAR